jgi:hypothetical protein
MQCKNNLRQLGLALNLHASENETYPLSIAPGNIPELESPFWVNWPLASLLNPERESMKSFVKCENF